MAWVITLLAVLHVLLWLRVGAVSDRIRGLENPPPPVPRPNDRWQK